MKANLAQLNKALLAPAGQRCFLFHGADDAGSRSLLKRLRKALGDDVERVELSGGDLKSDPARLLDEAASLAMFGGTRLIVVDPAGDESLAAVTGLIEAEVAGNPVVLVAGALKPTSKLLKLVEGAPNALAYASRLPDVRDLDRLVGEMARERQLRMAPDVARRIGEMCGANRAVIEQELEKYALFAGAAEIGHDVVDAIGAANDEGGIAALMDQLFDGRAGAAESELAKLRSEGIEGITLLRAALRRATAIAQARAGGSGARGGWVDRAAERQAGRWPADAVTRCIDRLLAAEREVKRPGGVGIVAADAELLAIARRAGRAAR